MNMSKFMELTMIILLVYLMYILAINNYILMELWNIMSICFESYNGVMSWKTNQNQIFEMYTYSFMRFKSSGNLHLDYILMMCWMLLMSLFLEMLLLSWHTNDVRFNMSVLLLFLFIEMMLYYMLYYIML